MFIFSVISSYLHAALNVCLKTIV